MTWGSCAGDARPRRRGVAGGLACAALVACSASGPETAATADTAPVASKPDDPWALPEATDENPDPRVFETKLEARLADIELAPGTKTPVWTYNGLLPGPLMRAQRGDRMIVHFTNRLPEATTIHWHGLRVPGDMDGVPDLTQPAVQPGDTFTYDFVVPDAGLFWYHPHVDSAAQVGFGLYGPVVVEDPDEPEPLGDERVLVLSDIALNRDGTHVDPTWGGNIATMFGREGDTLLVNGKVHPVLTVPSGARQRWRMVNAAKSRYFQVAIHGQSFTRIGGDGGLLARPQERSTIVLTPGQRADVVFDVALPPNGDVPVRWIPYDRGFGSTEFREPATIFTLRTDATPARIPRPLPTITRDIQPIDVSSATPQHMELTGSLDGDTITMGINGVPGSEAEPIMAVLGETQVWTVGNAMDFAHPFHLHGFFFQVLDVNGAPPEVLEWQDTVDVPVQTTVRLAVTFADRPGMWMFHCHILDHGDNGMMGMLHVH